MSQRIEFGSQPFRSWDVLLIGGASGTGKTSVSYRLAHHFAIGITEVDDFQVMLERMTTREQQPALHFWRTHPDPGQLSAEQIVEQGFDVRRVMSTALDAVIANHLEASTPVVLEGDFILPTLAAQTGFSGIPHQSRVRAVFLYEPDEARILQNFSEREPAAGPQTKRSRVSWLYGRWLQQECERLGLAALPARPWDTLFERILAAIN
jgi:2-phosphoglycerate kinase